MSKSHEQEKTDIVYSPPSPSIENGDIKFETEAHAGDDSFEIFKKEEGAVDFRTVSWIGASIIFLKSKSCGQIRRWRHVERCSVTDMDATGDLQSPLPLEF